MVDSLDAITCTVIFIIPGFVCTTIRKRFIPHRSTDTASELLPYLIWSSLVYGCLWLISAKFNIQIFVDAQSNLFNMIQHNPSIMAIVILVSVILSYSSSKAQIALQKFIDNHPYCAISKILIWFGIDINRSMPSAWDYIFSQEKQCYVILHLSNGKSVYGHCGESSCISRNEDGRDIYIDNVYKYNHGNWLKIHGTTGVWIKGANIDLIEFLEGTDESEVRTDVKAEMGREKAATGTNH